MDEGWTKDELLSSEQWVGVPAGLGLYKSSPSATHAAEAADPEIHQGFVGLWPPQLVVIIVHAERPIVIFGV